ncbi:MAG: phosphate/phosphite/phosphonate ABC transporter substrate-binding protein [Rubrobacter sp.]
MSATHPSGTRAEDVRELRFITYLAPSIPRDLFDELVDHSRRWLGYERATLQVETRVSGPEKGAGDPFSRNEADVGFVCSPSYLWLREREPPPVELLGGAPVYGDERNGGEPTYFCDVISHRDSAVESFTDLRGRSWAFNDACSLSGYYGLLQKLAEMGEDGRYFGRVLHSGSHLDSIRMVAQGQADAATIDSNVLRMRKEKDPALGNLVRVIDSWGPFPVQPVVVRSGFPKGVKSALRDAFLNVERSTALAGFGLKGFAPVTDKDYATERLALEACESIMLRQAPVSGPGVPPSGWDGAPKASARVATPSNTSNEEVSG